MIDPEYLNDAGVLDSTSDDYLDQTRKIERALKDRVRGQLGLAARLEKHETHLLQHARNNGIHPSYDLPTRPTAKATSGTRIRTFKRCFYRKTLSANCRLSIQSATRGFRKTGINVLHGAFGFLEWAEPGTTETSFAPLILLQVKFEKRKTKEGLEFWVRSFGEDPEINTVFSEKLRSEFGIQLPTFAGGSVEAYLVEVSTISPKTLSWRGTAASGLRGIPVGPHRHV